LILTNNLLSYLLDQLYKLRRGSINSHAKQNQQSAKSSLNNNYQQFHQFQQNEQPPRTSTNWTQLTYGVGNLRDLGLRHAED
jgi:hypothetical protein